MFDLLRLEVTSSQAICSGARGNRSFLGSTMGGGFGGFLCFGGFTRAGALGILKVSSPGGLSFVFVLGMRPRCARGHRNGGK